MKTPVFRTLRIVTTLLDDHLKLVKNDTSPMAMLQSIGLAKEKGINGVIVNLYKIEEEPILKNAPLQTAIVNGKIAQKNRPVILNLYVLFIAINQEEYGAALMDLSRIIEFFQVHTKFDAANTFEPEFDFELRHQLVSPSNEDINHIWSVNGGEQLPFVLYKFSLVPVDADKIKGQDLPIESINVIPKNNGS